MRGIVPIKIGRYDVSSTASLTVSLCDAGTVVAVHDRETGRRYFAIIDTAEGVVMSLPAKKASGETAKPLSRVEQWKQRVFPPPATPPAARNPKLPLGRRTLMPSTKFKFTLQYGRTKKGSNVGVVIGAFMQDGSEVTILYRVVGGGKVYYENQLLFHGTTILRGTDIPRKQRIADERWDEFLALPDHGMINEEIHWRKMSPDEIKMLIAGQTFRLNSDN